MVIPLTETERTIQLVCPAWILRDMTHQSVQILPPLPRSHILKSSRVKCVTWLGYTCGEIFHFELPHYGVGQGKEIPWATIVGALVLVPGHCRSTNHSTRQLCIEKKMTLVRRMPHSNDDGPLMTMARIYHHDHHEANADQSAPP